GAERREAVVAGPEEVIDQVRRYGASGQIDAEDIAPEGVRDVQIARCVEREGVQAASRARAAAYGKGAVRQAARIEGRRIPQDISLAEIRDVKPALRVELHPERHGAGGQRNRRVDLAVAIEDIDHIGLAEVEGCDVDPARRVGGDSLGESRAGLGQRCETDDAVVIGERRRGGAEYEYRKKRKHQAEKTLGHDLLLRKW